MKKILILILTILPLHNAFSDEMTQKDCKEFLPYHSYNIALSGICGELLPQEVVSRHIYLRGVCTQKLGETKSMELMKQGARKFGKTLSTVGQKEICRVEANMITAKNSTEAMTPENGSEPSHCEDIMATHGLLTRAQVVCNFSKYSNYMLEEAKKCSTDLGEEKTMEILKFGMKEFDRNVNELGQTKFCDALARDYPKIIEK